MTKYYIYGKIKKKLVFEHLLCEAMLKTNCFLIQKKIGS